MNNKIYKVKLLKSDKKFKAYIITSDIIEAASIASKEGFSIKKLNEVASTNIDDLPNITFKDDPEYDVIKELLNFN